MVLTIKNFESQNVGPGVVETAPTNLVGVAGTLKATLTWTSATGESGVTWTEEKLVRKEGSAPTGSMDGTTVATITTKDTYKTTGYEDTGLDSTKTYYYKVFAIYDNGTERGSTDVNVTPDGVPTESIMIKMMAGNDGTLKVPVAGRGTSGASCSYNWNISVDGETATNYSGTGTNTASITVATGLTAGSEHTVLITPVTEAYGWARAFAFYTTGVSNLLTEIIYDGSYMGYAVSATDTGGYFRAYQYQDCVNLRVAPAEYLPDTVINIGAMFRRYQYSGCVNLESAGTESMPSSVTNIGTEFRSTQYKNCRSLLRYIEAPFNNGFSSNAESYRQSQLNGCSALEELSIYQTSVTGSQKRYNYLLDAGNSTNPMVITINGNSLEEGTRFTQNAFNLNNANVSQIKVENSLVTAYQNSSFWSNIDDNKFGPINPPTLLSYEEIKAMVQTDAIGVTNAINELNSKKAEYIEKFRTENHIYQYSGSTAYLLSDDGTQGGLLLSYRGYRIAYDINMLTPMDEYFWGEINA